MSKTINGIPEFITREQYIGFFEALGIDPANAVEVRAAHDGIHAVVFATDKDGRRILAQFAASTGYPKGDPVTTPRSQGGFQKHRIFIPVRDDGDRRQTRIRPVKD